MKRNGKHFVVFYTEPYYREIADLVASKMGGTYARDIRHGGDPSSRAGEVLIGSRQEITYKHSHPLHQQQAAHTIIVHPFATWASLVSQTMPYANRDDWRDAMVDMIYKEISGGRR